MKNAHSLTALLEVMQSLDSPSEDDINLEEKKVIWEMCVDEMTTAAGGSWWLEFMPMKGLVLERNQVNHDGVLQEFVSDLSEVLHSLVLSTPKNSRASSTVSEATAESTTGSTSTAPLPPSYSFPPTEKSTLDKLIMFAPPSLSSSLVAGMHGMIEYVLKNMDVLQAKKQASDVAIDTRKAKTMAVIALQAQKRLAKQKL